MNLLDDLCVFINDKTRMPPLIKVGLAHYQFETIHPFLDGNGRIGRLLITLQLAKEGYLKKPILYISHYFRRNQFMYYGRLQNIRDEGDWKSWIRFFLNGINEVSGDSYLKIIEISELRERHRNEITENLGRNSPKGLKLMDELLRRPYQTVNRISELLDLSFPNANNIVSRMEEMGILREITGQKRNRIYEYSEYIGLLGD